MHNNFSLQYLIARYYNQETTRFIGEDTYKGALGDSITNNLYTYVGKISSKPNKHGKMKLKSCQEIHQVY